MIKTLYWYISWDLAKVTALALVALTFIMTVFAVMEPLRKEGLSGDQILSLFGYTIPAMLSLTLPVAALFAATIVYGRFSQDRELMACRASGISTLRLLRPALVLGGLVTVVSLVLSNFVSPKLAMAAEQSIRKNVRSIVFHQLRAKGNFKFGKYLVHAEYVNARTGEVGGFVMVNMRKSGAVNMLMASRVFLEIQEVDGQAYAMIDMVDPTAIASDSRQDFREERQPVLWLPVPELVREKPAFYEWRMLQEMYAHPEKHPDVQKELGRIAVDLCHRMVAQEVADAINAGRTYTLHGDGDYVVSAAHAKVDSGGVARLFAAMGPDGLRKPVVIRRMRDGQVHSILRAEGAGVRARRGEFSVRSTISLTVEGTARVILPGKEMDEGMTQLNPSLGPFEVPKHILDAAGRITSKDLYEHSERIKFKSIREKLHRLKDQRVAKLRHEIIGEMHSRISYGLSCMLLVAMGAALGIIFRGGQLISAFALCVVPATVVIVMLVMGKELVENPETSVTAGLTAIWSGNVLLLLADLYVYWRLMRR